QHPGVYIYIFQAVLQGQSVDDRGQHTHIIRRGAVHSLGAGPGAPPNIPAAYDDGDFHAQLVNPLDLPRDHLYNFQVHAEAGLARQRLTAQLEHNPAVHGLFGRHRAATLPKLFLAAAMYSSPNAHKSSRCREDLTITTMKGTSRRRPETIPFLSLTPFGPSARRLPHPARSGRTAER